MKQLYLLRFSLLLVALWTLSAQVSFGQVETVANGNWNAGATWQGGSVPAAGSDIVIKHNVVLNTTTVNVGNIEIQANTLTFGNSGTTRNLNVAGNFTMTGGNVTTSTNNTNHNLNIAGNFVHTSGTFNANNPNGRLTTTFNGGTTQQISGIATTFYNLATSGGGTTLNANATITVSNALNVGNATTLNLNAFAFTVNQGTTIGAGTSGVLRITSTTGAKQFNGLMTVSGGATFDNDDVNANVEFRGGITSTAGVFNAGTGTYSFTTNNQSLTGGTFTIPKVSVASGITLTNAAGTTLNVTDLTGAGGFTQGANSVLDISNTATITTLTANASGNSVNYSGAAQTIHGTSGYYHLGLAGSGAKTLQSTTTSIGGNLILTGTATTATVGTLQINGNLALSNATSMSVGGFTFTVLGSTFVGGGASGTLTFTGTANTKIFTGPVTIASGGTWNNSIGSPVTFRGGIINNGGTFTAGSGVQTFDTNNQSLSGTTTTYSIPRINVGGVVTLTNNGTLTVATDLAGTGGLTQVTNSVLNIGGPVTITTLNASSAANEVNYNSGAAQTIKGTNYWNLTLSAGGVKTMPASVASIAGNLTMSGTASTTTAGTLAIGGNLNIGSGSTFNVGNFALTVSGTTAVGGTLAMASSAIEKLYVGTASVAPGGTWNNSGSPVRFNNGISNNGIFNSGTGIHTFDVNNQALTGSFSIDKVTVTGITLTNTSNLIVASDLAGTGTLAQAPNASLNITGTSGITGLNATASGNTVTYNGAAQTVHSNDYVNLTLGGSGAKSLQAGTTSVSGNFTLTGGASTTTVSTLTIGNLLIGNSATFTVAGFPLTVTGTTTVGEGSGGALLITSAAGTKTFNGLVTIANGATWNNSGNSPVTFRGGIINNSTFTAGNGVHTFDTNAQSLTGTFTIPNVTVNTINLTNNNSLSVGTALSGTGTLIQGANALLNIGGTSGITNLVASGPGNTVSYTGAAQTLHSNNYANLDISGSGAKTLQGGTTMITGNLTIGGSAIVTAVTGLQVSGNISLGGSSTFVGGAFTHAVGMNWNNSGGTFNATGSTIAFFGSSQSINGPTSTTFNNVSTLLTSNTTVNIATTIGGNLLVDNTSNFTVGGVALTVNGTTTVGSGGAATLTLSSGTGTKTFTGLVSVSSGASWNNSGNSAATFRGGITNNGTFTAGSGLHTFDTNAQALNGGLLTIPNVTVASVNLTNNASTLIIGNSLAGSGTLTQGASTNLDLGGSVGITSFNASAASNTVRYTGSNQTIFPTSYQNLIISQTAGEAALSGSTSVGATLTLTNGNLNIGSNNLLLGANAVSVSSPSASRMIIASGTGEVRRTFTGTGSYDFPIGDNTGTPDYSPITINYTAGSFSSAYVGVSVTDAKHPSNSSTTNYLSRYWSINQSGVTGGVATITATYPSVDIVGTESLVKGAHLSGAFNQATNPWTKYTALGSNTLTATGVAPVSGQTSYITGLTGNDLTVSIAGTPFTICNGGSVTLNTSVVGGDGPFTYSWAPTAGLSATTVASPTASPTTTTVYTVTVKDANGITGTANATVNVNPVPTLSSTLTPSPICSAATFSYTPTSTPTGATFTWSRAAVSGISEGASSGTDAVSETLTNVSNVPVAVTYSYIPTLASCPGAAQNVVVYVLPSPAVTKPADVAACNTVSVAAINFTGTATSYDWVNNTPSIGLAASGTGNIASFTATNAGAVAVVATVTVTPKYTYNAVTCSGTPQVFTITVQPTQTVSPVSNQELCNGAATTAITFAGGASTYSWTNDTPSIGLAASGTGNIASFNAINSTAAPVVATVVVTPSSGSCVGSTTSFTITVNPTPTVAPIASQVVCNTGSTTAVSFTGTGTSYTWTNDTPSIGLLASGSGNIASFTATNSGTSPVVATITVTPVFTAGTTCNGATRTFTITVNPTPSVTKPADQVVCNGGSTTTVNFSGTGTSYDWTNSAPGIGLAASGSGNIASFTATNAGSTPVVATITITPKYTFGGTTCSGAIQIFSITVNPTPVASAVSSQVVCNGGNTTAVSFTGTATSYTWTNNNTSIGLAASGTGNIAAFPAINTGSVHTVATITVTPVYGSCNGTPINFTITVNPTPAVNTVADQTVCNGANTTAITFTGSGTTYDWTNDTPGIGLAASGTGNIAAFAATNSGSTPLVATITITPKYTFGAVTCNGPVKTFQITVNHTPSVNTVSNQEVCNGTSTAGISFSGTGNNYTWTNNTPSIGLPASGTGDIGAFTAINSSGAAVIATITVTPRFGTCNGPTKNFTITVNPTPTVAAIPSQVVCNTGSTTAVSFTGTGTSYTWTNDTPSIGLLASGSGNIASFTATNSGTSPVVATITVTPVFTAGTTCNGATRTFTITVNPTPSVTKPADQVVCNGGSTTTVNFSGTATSYDWTNSAPSIGLAASGSGNIASFTATNAGSTPVVATITITPKYTFGGTTCSGATQIFSITVNPTPVASAVSSQVVCNGGNTTAVSFTGTATGYTWTNNNTSIGLAASGTGNIAAFPAINTGSVHTVATITVTPVYGSCNGTPINFTITVNPTPAVNTVADQTVCNGANTTAITFTGSGTTYDWTNDTPGIGLAASGTGNIAAFAATNSGSTPLVATITITPKYTFGAVTCNGPVKTFQITVNHTPSVNTVSNQEVCNGTSTAGISFSGTGNNYTWINNTPSIGLPASGTGDIGAFTAINSSGAAVIATITVTPRFGSCNGPTKNFTITVNPTPTVAAIPSQVVCNTGSTTAVSFTGTGTSYTWTNDTPSIGLLASGTGNIASFTATNSGTSPVVATITVTPVFTAGTTCNGATRTFTITVNPTPSVTKPADQVVCNGGSTTAINYSGTGTSYDWTNSAPGIGLAASGSGNIASFTATNAGSTPVVATITITPKYTFGGTTCSGAIQIFSITVNPTPVASAVSNQVVCNGGNTTAVSFTGTATGYTWTNNNTSIGLAASGTGNIAAFPAINTGSIHTVATITVTPVYGSCNGTPINFTITVNPTPAVNTVVDQTVCNGANTTAITFTGSGTTYDWTNDTPGIGLAASGTGNIAAFAATNSGSTPLVATITITPKYTFGAVTCNGPVKTFQITVQHTPSVNTVSNQEICNGTSTASVTFAGTGDSYTWTNDTPGIGLAASGTGNIAAFIAINNGTSPVTATITITPRFAGSCTGSTKTFTYLVNPTPTFTATNNAANICSATATNISFASSTAGHRINVVSVSYGAVTGGTVVAGTTSYTNGNTLTETLTNNTTAPIDVVYTFNVTTPSTNPVCPVAPVNQVVTVRVQPAPAFTTTNGAAQICSGSQANITLNTAVTGAQIRLQSVSYGAASGTLTAGALYNNGQKITEVLSNTTNSPVTVTYVFDAIVGSCAPSATQNVQVVVNPNPTFTATNNAATICSATATNIAFTSPTAGHQINVVSVTYGSVTGGTITPGTTTFVSGGSLAETLTNNTTAPIDVVYVFNVTTPATTPSCPIAPSNQSVTVRVLPAPTFTLTNTSAQLCSGSQANITLNTTVSGTQVRLKSVNYGAVAGTLSPGALYNNGQQITEVLVNNTNSPVTVVYTFEAVVGSCTPSVAQTTNVIVNPNPTFTATNNASNICSGASTNISFASPTSGHRINVVSVSYGAVTGGTVTAGTTTFLNGATLTEALTNTTNNPIDVVYVFNVTTPATTPTCPISTTNQTITVRVQPSSSFTTANNAPKFCSGGQTNIVLNTPTTGAQIRLASVSYGAASGTLTAGAFYTNGQRIAEVLTNNTNLPVTVAYTFESIVSGCTPSAQQTVNVIVDPIPTLATNLTTQELCEGQVPTLTLTNPNNVSGTQYTWTMSTTNVTGAVNQSVPTSAAAINTALSLSSGTIGTITYTVRSIANGCYSAPETIQVTVRRQATVGVPVNTTVCEPTSIPLNGTIGGGASTATWSRITGAGTLSATNVVAGSPIQANATYSVDMISDVASSVTMRLTTNDPDGPTGLCVAVSADYTIAINRSAKVDAGPDLAQCEDLPSIALQGSAAYAPAGVQWTLVSAAGTFSNAASATSNYSYANPSEKGTTVTLRLTAKDPDGLGAGGPCLAVSDVMTVKINRLPIVNFVGFPGSSMAKNEPAIKLTGNQVGGLFSITPTTSIIGSTTQNPTDQVTFNPDIVDVGPNTVKYSYTDVNGCTNSQSQNIQINPVTSSDWGFEKDVAYHPTDEDGVLLSSIWAICGNQNPNPTPNLVRLVGEFDVTTGNPGTMFFGPVWNPALNKDEPKAFSLGRLYGDTIRLILQNNQWYLNTTHVRSDEYRIVYRYVNEFDASSDKEYTVRVNASPITLISVDNSCVRSSIQFNDASTLPSTPFPTSIAKWNWDFGDGTYAPAQNPRRSFGESGYYDITLTATTNLGCVGSTTKQIRVGDVPEVEFNWTAICTEDKTKFVDASSAGISRITEYTWDFGDGRVIIGAPDDPITGDPSTIGTFKNPEHIYGDPGRYNTKLTINTEDGCVNSLTQSVNIFETVPVAPSIDQAYLQSFEGLKTGWSAEALLKEKGITNVRDSIRYSWKLSAPDGSNINSASDGSKAWWTGNRITVDPYGANNPRYENPLTYFSSESSAVNGPCFDLRDLTRPMISLDYWSDSETNRDGAVVQYSTDGGLTWELVGAIGGTTTVPYAPGIHWYNASGIIGKPGNQRAAGDYGWSGKTEGWVNARFNLDMIDATKRKQVRLRVAFGSDDNNETSSGETYNGFAFDNVFVGNKTHNVLVEHFTSADNGSLIGDDAINRLFNDQVTARILYGGQSDFHDIQYHISSIVADPLNKDNEIDPGARQVFMGVSAPPTTLLDGIRNDTLKGVFSDVTQIEIDRRALKAPDFLIELDTVDLGTTLNSNNKIKPTVKLTAQKDFNTPLLLNIALIEDVGTNKNVLRKLLFGPDGLTITNTIGKGQVISRDKDVITIDVPVTNPTGLTMIAFIQNKLTREVYQSQVMKVGYKVGQIPVGLEDEEPEESVITRNVKIFPNPASGKFYFGLPDNLTGDNYKWKLSDQRGVVVSQGNFTDAVNDQLGVDINQFANGMYIIVIEGPNKTVAYHKLMVMNHH